MFHLLFHVLMDMKIVIPQAKEENMCGHRIEVASLVNNHWIEIESLELSNARTLSEQQRQQAVIWAKQVAADAMWSLPESVQAIGYAFANCNGIDEYQELPLAVPVNANDKLLQTIKHLAAENQRLRRALAMYSNDSAYRPRVSNEQGQTVLALGVSAQTAQDALAYVPTEKQLQGDNNEK